MSGSWSFAAATISLPLGNNSLFSTFHSIDGRPGPVTRRVNTIDKGVKIPDIFLVLIEHST
jgi:hypothetical protein